MRRAWTLALLLGFTGQAAAEFEPAPPQRRVHHEDFWRDTVDPHAEEVEDLLNRVREALQRADASRASDLDLPAMETRDKVYDDLFHILTYARRLSPANTNVLALLGRVDIELGKTREAIEAFTTCISLTGPDKAGSETPGRLGLVYLERGELDDAIRWLRVSVANASTERDYNDYLASWSEGYARVHLATALALRDEHHAATELLARQNSLGGEPSLVQFALAVMFDRQEQRGAAFEVLDRMQTQLETGYASQVQSDLAMFPFAPEEDRHYYQALFYETVGNFTEARTEWITYAASGDAPYRARALEHVAVIDAQRRAAVTHAPGIQVPPSPYYPSNYRRKIRVMP